MLKKIISIILLTSCSPFIFISCNSKNHEPLTLVMAEVNPEDTVAGQMDKAFKEKVEELSKGKIIIDVQYSGILGDENQVMRLLKSEGTSIQLVRGPANISAYTNGYPVKSSLISIPYTFSNDDHFWNFAKSDIAQDILNEPYELGFGIKGLFYGQEGLRHYFSTVKIETVSDLKGKKMRVSGTVLPQLANAFEAIPIEIKYTDLYASLQTGKTEIAEQPISNYLQNAFYHVAPYMIFDGHMLGAISVMINARCWDSLSADQQNILLSAGEYACDYCHKIVDEANKEALAQLKQKGVVFTEVTDSTPWQNACSEIRKEAASINPIL